MKNEQYTFTSWQACREYFDKEVLNKDPKWTIGDNDISADGVFEYWCEDNAEYLEIKEAKELEESDNYDRNTCHQA